MIESIERMRKLVNDNLVMGLRFQMNRELNELEREIEQELNSRAERTCHAIAIYNMHDEWCADECSACGYEWYEDEPNYCPNCGAKVTG